MTNLRWRKTKTSSGGISNKRLESLLTRLVMKRKSKTRNALEGTRKTNENWERLVIGFVCLGNSIMQ
jgi:hypothetical protein